MDHPGTSRTGRSCIARLVGACIVFASLLVAHAARAAGALVGTVQASTDDLTSILVTYGPAVGTMYALYLAARSVVARAATDGAEPGRIGRIVAWLRVGKRLAYATSAVGITTAAIQVALTGAPWNVVLATTIAAAFKLITPGVPAPSSGPPASSAAASPA